MEGGRADKSFGEEIEILEGEEGVRFRAVTDCDLMLLREGEKDCSERDREWKIVDENGSAAQL